MYSYPQAFTIMDQNRDGFIDKEDLRDTFAALGRHFQGCLVHSGVPGRGSPRTPGFGVSHRKRKGLCTNLG